MAQSPRSQRCSRAPRAGGPTDPPQLHGAQMCRMVYRPSPSTPRGGAFRTKDTNRQFLSHPPRSRAFQKKPTKNLGEKNLPTHSAKSTPRSPPSGTALPQATFALLRLQTRLFQCSVPRPRSPELRRGAAPPSPEMTEGLVPSVTELRYTGSMKCDSRAPCKPRTFQRKILSLQDMVRSRSPCWIPSHVGTMSLDSTGMVPSPAQEKKAFLQRVRCSEDETPLSSCTGNDPRRGVVSGVSPSPCSGNFPTSDGKGNSAPITDKSLLTWLKENEIVLEREGRNTEVLHQTSPV